MSIEIRVPALGESITEATVGKWFRQTGEAVKADEPLVELETDKVTVEVPAPASGVLGDILVKSGSTVAVGSLLAALKEGAAKNFLVVDAAMNDLIRPTLYEAHHDIRPVAEPKPGTSTMVADVVGGICETGDYLALGRTLPCLGAGDLIAIMTAGAYGAVQGGTYNTRPLAAEVLVNGREWAVVRPRQTYDELIGLDRVAPWLRTSVENT